MPRFFLIDSWLADAKGHNFQYALDVCGAAQQRGYEPVVGVRRVLSSDIRFPENWRIERVFEYGECPRHWIGLDGRNPHPCDLDGAWLADSGIRWWERVLGMPAKQDRRRRIASFSRACIQLFTAVSPLAEDLLFLPSMAEFDFLCAARFWRDQPWTKDFDWHIQFHFNFFLGRDPEFDQQTAVLRRFQRQFRAAVDQIPEHRLHFYATSEAVARQYDSLGIAIFHPLPYPVRSLSSSARVSRATESHASRARHAPLRVTLAGGIRHEKGKKQIHSLIDSLWDDFLRPGELQLVFQAPAATIEKRLPKRLRGTIQIRTTDQNGERSPLLTAPHPLDAEKYAELIRESDIGLLAYDSRRYFSRVSGVLCEMLSAGVPVIVPAGCWLADQIAEEKYRQVDSLWRQWRNDSAVETFEPAAEFVIETGSVPPHTVLVRCNWPSDTLPGTYLELAVETNDSRSGKHRYREILGVRQEGPIGAVVRLPAGSTAVKLSIQNAFDSRRLTVPRMEVLRPRSTPEAPPVSRVGLIAADDGEMPRILREMITHYGHYQRTAREFAKEWQNMHSPDCTVTILESRRGNLWQRLSA